ncbi:MAG TPA: glycosyltransferase [Chloroflexota bacterium]|nr:glycosyltransferase [Chloroflexota bacterium]
MPCLLKARTPSSPGIVTFTSNEAMTGIVARSARLRASLTDATRRGEWLFGVHIQGNYSWLEAWPDWDWQAFVMWPDPNARFISRLPADKRLGLNCVSFLAEPPWESPPERLLDICIVSRPSKIKRIYESLLIVRGLLDKRPDLKVAFVVPDPRKMEWGARSYKRLNLDRRFFELPLKMFSATELKRISFLAAASESFGRFPVTSELVAELVARSRFLLLTSHSEGTPRVLAEALTLGTPCIVSRSLQSGIEGDFDETNSLLIDDNIEVAVRQIDEALTDYGRFAVDVPRFRQQYCAKYREEELKQFLGLRLQERGYSVDGEWFLHDLPQRLCGHGQKLDAQFEYNDALFHEWLRRVSAGDPYDEDFVIGDLADRDKPTLLERGHITLRALRSPVRSAGRRMRPMLRRFQVFRAVGSEQT